MLHGSVLRAGITQALQRISKLPRPTPAVPEIANAPGVAPLLLPISVSKSRARVFVVCIAHGHGQQVWLVGPEKAGFQTLCGDDRSC